MKKKLVISTGAGISAESGISTFRDADGLWEKYPVMEVASAEGFARNPALEVFPSVCINPKSDDISVLQLFIVFNVFLMLPGKHLID